MTQNTRKSLVAIQILIALLTLVMLAAGLFGIRATEKIGKQQRRSSELNWDQKLRPSIGMPYTEERHYQFLELMRDSDGVITSSYESLAAASEVMRDIGAILALGSLASICLLLKKPRSPEKDSPP